MFEVLLVGLEVEGSHVEVFQLAETVAVEDHHDFEGADGEEEAELDAAAAVEAAVDAARSGECVIVYPEGTITKDPDLWPMAAKTGAARIALTAGVPVIPMAHWGAQDVMGPYRKEFKAFPRKTMHVLIGAPVDLDDLRTDGEPDAEALREATDRVMSAITVLLRDVRKEQEQTSRPEAA